MKKFLVLSLINVVIIVFVFLNVLISVKSELDQIIDLRLEDGRDFSENDFEDRDGPIVLNKSGCFCRYRLSINTTYCHGKNSCTNFSSDFYFPSDKLTIFLSAIRILKVNSFVSNKQLIALRLEENDELNKIESGAFNGLNRLVNMTIAYNKNLLSLENNTFSGLNNLGYLKLYDNGFNEFKDFLNPVLQLKKLQTLKIGQMQFPEVDENTFKDIKSVNVEALFLVTCMLKKIHPKSFNVFKNLKVLNLGENLLLESNLIEIVKEIRDNKINLTALSVENVSFGFFPVRLLEEIGKSNISELALNNLKFDTIGKFPYMPNLYVLNMNKVLAFKVHNESFNNIVNLKQLYLESANFYNFPQAVSLPKIELLDISNGGKYFNLPKNSLKGMDNLKFLNLSLNSLRILNNNLFEGLTNLQTLILRKINVLQINNYTFLNTPNLLTLDLGNNQYFTTALSKFAFSGLEKLEELFLDMCGIENFYNVSDTFADLKSLKSLILTGNSIKYLPTQFMKTLDKLEVLDLSLNNFVRYEDGFSKRFKNLKSLKLSNNKLEYFTTAMINDFLNIESVQFENNPFVCNCNNLKILGTAYFKNTNNFTEKINSYKIYCYYPTEYRNLTLYNYVKQIRNELVNGCDILSLHQNVLIEVFLIFFVVLLIFSLVITYIYRFEIRYYLFLIKIFLNSKTSSYSLRKPCNYYIYDAFVSYCNEDSEFVVALVNNLEKSYPFFKLCVYERDFEIGTVITESVLNHVAKSRKTILVVSEQFIKSQWCRWEVQVAENHTVFFKNDRSDISNDSVIIIKIGKLDSKNITPMLKYLMKTRIYLEWEHDKKKQTVFWNKLRKSLGSSKAMCKSIRH